MRITQLRSFFAVGRHGSVTAAANAMHVSQPTVTTQVKALEETYGVELFHRQGRSITLTAVGSTLYAIAQRIFSAEQEAVDFLKEAGGMKAGHITVGAVGPFHALEIVARFHELYPGIEVSVKQGNSEETVRSLLTYESDVAVLAQYAADPRLCFVPFRQHPLVIIVPATARFAAYTDSIRLEDLRDIPLIVREPGSTTRKVLDDALRQRRIQPVIFMEVGSREAVREAVLLGLGVAAVSEREHVADARIRMLRIEGANLFTFAHVVCLNERRQTRLVSEFFKVVEEILGV